MSGEISANLILVSGEGYDVSYLVQTREVDKSDHPKKALFQPGKYPFYIPGGLALFGGAIDPDENPKEAFARELQEELGWVNLEDLSEFNQRFYNWEKDTPRILAEAEEVFQGNVAGFLGFGLNEKIPGCLLGNDRKRYEGTNTTYKDWLYNREGDYYFIGDIQDRSEYTDKEGAGAVWLRHDVVRAGVFLPGDKIVFLDDMTRRIKSGKLEIKVKK